MRTVFRKPPGIYGRGFRSSPHISRQKAPCKVLKPCGVFACILCFSLFYLNFYLPGVGIYLTLAAGGGFGDLYTARI